MVWENSIDCCVFGVESRSPHRFSFTIEKLVSEMDANLVDKAVIHYAGSDEIEDHGSFLNDLSSFPARFRGLMKVHSKAPALVSYMNRVFEHRQIVGFIVDSISDNLNPFDVVEIEKLEAYKIWSTADQLGAVLVIDVQVAEAHIVPYFLERFPNVKVIAPRSLVFRTVASEVSCIDVPPRINVDMPTESKFTIQCWSEFPNLYVCLSGYYSFSKEAWPYNDIRRWFEPENFVDRFGADRIMWGSEFPWTSNVPGYDRTLDFVKNRLQYVTADQQKKIARDTALNLLF